MKNPYPMLMAGIGGLAGMAALVGNRMSAPPMPVAQVRPHIELQRQGGGRDVSTDWLHPSIMIRVWADLPDSAIKVYALIDDWLLTVHNQLIVVGPGEYAGFPGETYTLVGAKQLIGPIDQPDLDSKAATSWGVWKIIYF